MQNREIIDDTLLHFCRKFILCTD